MSETKLATREDADHCAGWEKLTAMERELSRTIVAIYHGLDAATEQCCRDVCDSCRQFGDGLSDINGRCGVSERVACGGIAWSHVFFGLLGWTGRRACLAANIKERVFQEAQNARS